jgi:hypothetical protein
VSDFYSNGKPREYKTIRVLLSSENLNKFESSTEAQTLSRVLNSLLTGYLLDVELKEEFVRLEGYVVQTTRPNVHTFSISHGT